MYYRIYSSEGKRDETAKTSFDESHISLGRINILFIAPPHTAGSLKACIAKVEGLVAPGHVLYRDMELFQDTDSDAAMSDTDVISFQGDIYPGSDEGDPVALVNATADTAVDQKAKPTSGKVLSEYPLDSATTNRALPDGPDPNFTKHGRLKCSFSPNLISPAGYEDKEATLLSLTNNEIVHTDGIIITVKNTENGISFLFC